MPKNKNNMGKYRKVQKENTILINCMKSKILKLNFESFIFEINEIDLRKSQTFEKFSRSNESKISRANLKKSKIGFELEKQL